MGVVINRPPRDGHMAFIRSPDGISVELLQKRTARSNRPNRGLRWPIPEAGDIYLRPPRTRKPQPADKLNAASDITDLWIALDLITAFPDGRPPEETVETAAGLRRPHIVRLRC
jgi:hypothetical protein